jgi:hypothetical protein
MIPILLIHGYSAESSATDPASIKGIYGTLPDRLKAAYGADAVFEVDVSRYVTLNDGVTIDDLSRALDRALRDDFQKLLTSGFQIIIHSTGALVARNWVRRFAREHPGAPLKRIIYLAGALLGSGWAHIGKGQLAKWGRKVFEGGAERGVQVLDALEFGSSWTLDLHVHFLQEGSRLADYGVREAAIIGTQADVAWFMVPIRYAKEDGSDGVVRVAAGNPNYNYVRLEATAGAYALSWADVRSQVQAHTASVSGAKATFYGIAEESYPGGAGRPYAPMAIAYECSHTGNNMGIVSGQQPMAQVFALVRAALDSSDSDAAWANLVDTFNAATGATFDQAKAAAPPPFWKRWIDEPHAQYDPHAQFIIRVFDQNDRPVEHFDLFFDSDGQDTLPVGKLFEDKHLNERSPNCICFYLRTSAWDGATQSWADQLAKVGACHIEVTAVEPQTDSVQYVPLRVSIPPAMLTQWIKPHATTIVDVKLLRVPAPELFMIAKA